MGSFQLLSNHRCPLLHERHMLDGQPSTILFSTTPPPYESSVRKARDPIRSCLRSMCSGKFIRAWASRSILHREGREGRAPQWPRGRDLLDERLLQASTVLGSLRSPTPCYLGVAAVHFEELLLTTVLVTYCEEVHPRSI